jgi:hypothetical protein
MKLKPLFWVNGEVFGRAKTRGFGLGGEFAAFCPTNMSDEQIADKKAEIEADYQARTIATILNHLERDDTGRLTSDYEPSAAEIEVLKGAIGREFGVVGTRGYYIRIIKALRAVQIEDARRDVILDPLT